MMLSVGEQLIAIDGASVDQLAPCLTGAGCRLPSVAVFLLTSGNFFCSLGVAFDQSVQEDDGVLQDLCLA